MIKQQLLDEMTILDILSKRGKNINELRLGALNNDFSAFKRRPKKFIKDFYFFDKSLEKRSHHISNIFEVNPDKLGSYQVLDLWNEFGILTSNLLFGDGDFSLPPYIFSSIDSGYVKLCGINFIQYSPKEAFIKYLLDHRTIKNEELVNIRSTSNEDRDFVCKYFPHFIKKHLSPKDYHVVFKEIHVSYINLDIKSISDEIVSNDVLSKLISVNCSYDISEYLQEL